MMTYIQPLTLGFLLVSLIGLLRLRHCKGAALPMFGLVGLLLLSWPPVDWLLSQPLEGRYSVRPLESAPADAIVVLSSAVDPPRYVRPYPLVDHETYQRCEFAAWLHNHWQPLPVLACGGAIKKREQALSATMRQLLQRAGVPNAMIWTEERSRSTYENALYGAEVLRERGIKRIALVVEAQSMSRAAACFRKQGIAVVPAPCHFREFGPWVEELIPSWKAVKVNETTLHETVGLVWYWLRGWI